MRHFDLRLCTLVAFIRVVISQTGGISWYLTKLFCLLLLLLLPFSFVSVEVPLTLFNAPSFHTPRIRQRFGNRPLSTAVAFMASLICPQRLFWYVCPLILLLSFSPTARFVDHGLRSLQAVIPINQVYDILISAVAIEVKNEPHPQQDEPDLEANIEAQEV